VVGQRSPLVLRDTFHLRRRRGNVHNQNSVPTIDLVIVDDHPLASSGIARILKRETDLRVAAECLSGVEAVEAVQRTKPAVVVFELHSPHASGAMLLRAVRNVDAHAQVVVVTRNIGERENLRTAGVTGFVTTDLAGKHLAACIRAVHDGATWIEYVGNPRTSPSSSPAVRG
jgi:DNA-binding NarL/FixJ family response regulator